MNTHEHVHPRSLKHLSSHLFELDKVKRRQETREDVVIEEP